MYILTKLRTFASNIVQFSEKMSHIFKQFCAPLKRHPSAVRGQQGLSLCHWSAAKLPCKTVHLTTLQLQLRAPQLQFKSPAEWEKLAADCSWLHCMCRYQSHMISAQIIADKLKISTCKSNCFTQRLSLKFSVYCILKLDCAGKLITTENKSNLTPRLWT